MAHRQTWTVTDPTDPSTESPAGDGIDLLADELDPTAPGGARWGSSGSDPASAAAPPSSWRRRGVILVLLLFVGGLLWWDSRTGGDEGPARDPSVVQLQPTPGSKVLRQSTVGAELESGYDGRLAINGTSIPEAQMEGAIDPSSVSPEELRKLGIRPNSRNRVFFTPGKGKVLEVLPPGEVTITLRYFLDRHDPASGRVVTWTFQAD